MLNHLVISHFALFMRLGSRDLQEEGLTKG